MNIAIILGSIRENRRSDKVALQISNQLNEIDGIESVLLDLRDYSFPVMQERFRFLNDPPQSMAKFSEALNKAEGIIIVTPEYNGSYSGVLKNTLDYFKAEYVKKAIGVVTVSDGIWGGINASHHLLAWALHVKAIPSPYKLMVRNVGQLFDDSGKLLDPDFQERINRFLKEFLWLTDSISNKK